MNATHLLSSGNLLWEILEKYGHDPVPLFAAEGVQRHMLYEEGRRIDFQIVNRLWREAERTIDDPCFGLEAGNIWHPSFFGALGYAWLASRSLRTALKRLERFSHIVSEKTDVMLKESDEAVHLILSDSMQPMAYIDAALAVIVKMCRLNCGNDFNPVSINVIHPQPDCSGRYYSYFRSPVTFASAVDSILFARDHIDERLPGGNPHLESISDQLMIATLAEMDRENIIHRVQSAIIDHMHDGRITIAAVAKELGMSVRSLQRQLNRFGTVFGTLVDDTRRALAEQYLMNPREDLTEIAFRLGFAELSSFSRAFKRWTGMTPNAFRTAQR